MPLGEEWWSTAGGSTTNADQCCASVPGRSPLDPSHPEDGALPEEQCYRVSSGTQGSGIESMLPRPSSGTLGVPPNMKSEFSGRLKYVRSGT
jgi:hypothetical protein